MSTTTGRNRHKQLVIVTPEEELENLKNEVGVLRRAVESKSAAVGILRGELQECQKERDKFRTLAEQGGNTTTLHRPPPITPAKASLSDPGRSAMVGGGDGVSLAQLLCQAKEENRSLRQEATELRCRLHDAHADTKVLREEVQRWRGGGEGRRVSQANTALTQLGLQERERFISQMEELSAKCQALEGDVRGLIEEREELVRELDSTHHKLHRLNYILNTILSSPHYSTSTTTNTSTATTANTANPPPPKRIVDLDAIITENRYLQQRLKQAEEEVTLAKSNSFKYKSALERCRTHGSVKLGTADNLIVTPKQVSELLREYRGEVDGQAESDLRSVCVALVDALGQRSRALRTQRSANRVLVDRVNELERRLMDHSGGQRSNSEPEAEQRKDATPADLPLAAQELMEGYTPPAGRLGLAWVKEEDASRDPRLARFLRPLNNTNLTSDLRGVGDGQVQVSDGNSSSSDEFRSKARTDVGVVASTKESDAESVGRNDNGENDRRIEKCKKDCILKDIIKEEEEEEEEEVSEIVIMKTVIENETKNVKEDIVVLANEEDAPITSDPQRLKMYPDDDTLEEIVPLDQLDAYIREIQMNRMRPLQKEREERTDVKNNKRGIENTNKMCPEKKDMGRGRMDVEEEKEIDDDLYKRSNVGLKEVRSERDSDDRSRETVEGRSDTEENETVKKVDVEIEKRESKEGRKTEVEIEKIKPEERKVKNNEKETRKVKNNTTSTESETRNASKGNRKTDEMEILQERKLDENKVNKGESDNVIRGRSDDKMEARRDRKDITRAGHETENVPHTATPRQVASDENSQDDDGDDDDSFDLDLSDYDSDNDNLDLALQEWQKDCGGGGKPGAERSPAHEGEKKRKTGQREGFRLWRKEPKGSATDVELPSALQALLDKATSGASLDDAGWTM